MAVLAGFLGGWLLWAQYLNRTTFTFYSIVILPWIVLAICYVLDWLRTHAEIGTYRLTVGLGLMLIILVSAFFYPIWTAIPVPYEFWLSRMWSDMDLTTYGTLRGKPLTYTEAEGRRRDA